MNPPRLRQIISAFCLCLALAACGKGGSIRLPKLQLPGSAPFDTQALESAIDSGFGGLGTCVIIADTASGRELYRYNSNAVCMNPLPPCATFDVASALIGLDAGLITPQTVYRWDGSPQPVTEWQHDMDLPTAFKGGVQWWFQRLAGSIGPQLYQSRLEAFDYGDKTAAGTPAGFWMGPVAGGGKLAISARQQAQFLHRLYAGKLPVKPQTQAAVEQLLADETRGGYAVSGAVGDCPSLADRSQRVSWWIGRLKGPKADEVFAISMQQTTDAALPAQEVRVRAKSAFAQAGLWPES